VAHPVRANAAISKLRVRRRKGLPGLPLLGEEGPRFVAASGVHIDDLLQATLVGAVVLGDGRAVAAQRHGGSMQGLDIGAQHAGVLLGLLAALPLDTGPHAGAESDAGREHAAHHADQRRLGHGHHVGQNVDLHRPCSQTAVPDQPAAM
jgi:hypothetical protein